MKAAADMPTIVTNATGCLEVATTIFPFTSWNVPWLHNAFENAAANASGIEAAWRAQRRSGKGPLAKYENLNVIAYAGDGGTYDIGFQALSGALERGHHFTYVLMDNEAYMNTGIQRSGGTPLAASTTTSPAGSVIPGKGISSGIWIHGTEIIIEFRILSSGIGWISGCDDRIIIGIGYIHVKFKEWVAPLPSSTVTFTQ